MAYPNVANKLNSFTDDGVASPTSPHSGSDLDAEYTETRRAISEIVAYLEGSSLSSAGALKTLTVGLLQLDPTLVLALFGEAAPDLSAYETSIAADAAAADTARIAAETAQTGAETAETNAETAQTAAEVAQAAAEAAAASGSFDPTDYALLAGATFTGDVGITKTTPIFSLTSGADVARFFISAAVAYIEGVQGKLYLSDQAVGNLTELKARIAGAWEDILHTANHVQASQAEAEAGTEDTKWMTALQTAQAIAALESGGLTRGTAVATTSGTEHLFGSLPAGINRITMMFDGVSLSGTDELLIQIGDAGGIEASAYRSGTGDGSGGASSTTGFVINASGVAAEPYDGLITLVRQNGDTWVAGGVMSDGGIQPDAAGGWKDLSAELTQIQIAASGSDTFDLGSVNIMYE